jgi:hypothetical protein
MRPIRRNIACLALVAVLLGPAGGVLRRLRAEDLLAEAKQIAARRIKQFGDGYEAKIDTRRRIVYVSALDAEHLRQTIALVSAYIDAQQRTLLDEPLRWNVTILLPTVEDYRPLAPAANVIGFYQPARRTVTSIDRRRVLIHEFTHAMHHADMARRKQVHPPWVSEGLATLFERSRIRPSGLEPVHGPRLVRVQRAIRQGKAIALQDLLEMGQDDFMARSDLAYAQARYLMFYLYQKQRLKVWYRRYTGRFSRDPHGIGALRWALSGPIRRIEKQWHKWVLDQELPVDPRRGQASLGLELRDTRAGVKVVGLVDGSAGQTAGRVRQGDIILKFNGHQVLTTMQLAALIRGAGANRTVTLEVKRRGRVVTVRQPLGAAK